MIEIPGVARPRPASHGRSGPCTGVFKTASEVSVQTVAHRVLSVECTGLWIDILVKNLLLGDADTGCRPHVGNVEVFPAVIVKIKPRNTHAGADVLHTGLAGYIGEGAVAIVPIKVFASEIVNHVEVWPEIAVIVTPTATETEAGVVLIEAGLPCDIAKGSVPIVAHHEIGRTILCLVIRHGVAVLIRALVIGVKAEIDVQPSVAVVIRNGGAGEGALGRISKLESIRLEAEFSASLIEKE